MGLTILFLFPFVMKYSFKLNEGIVDSIQEKFFKSNDNEDIVGSYIGGISDIQFDQVFEERSPAYITKSDYVYSIGSPEATMKYFEQLEAYQKRGDIMRIIRSMAGITGKFVYVALWFVMLWQMIVLLYVYTKRYLMIAFLIIVFPVVVIEYIIGSTITGKSKGFSAWCLEFYLNVFIQTIHAVVYGVIGSVVTAQIQDGLARGKIESANWILLIVAVNFIFEGENILKKIIKANAESLKGAGESAQELKEIGKRGFGMAKGTFVIVGKSFKGKDSE